MIKNEQSKTNERGYKTKPEQYKRGHKGKISYICYYLVIDKT